MDKEYCISCGFIRYRIGSYQSCPICGATGDIGIGPWKPVENAKKYYRDMAGYYCGRCRTYVGKELTKFCPSCGASMEGE